MKPPCLVALLCAALAAGFAAGCAAVPVEGAQNPRPGAAAPRFGSAPAAAGQHGVTVEAMRAAVLADAASAWPDAERAALRVDAEPVTWPDGAMGCPTPGVMYTQALVPGWRLVVSDGRREMIYHASQRGAWVQCPAGRATRPLPGSSTR